MLIRATKRIFTSVCERAIFLLFCWPCIIVYQYNETNVMHFSLSLLRIKGLYMFRAVLAYPQEAPHKRHLVYCVRVMSVGCATIAVGLYMFQALLAYPQEALHKRHLVYCVRVVSVGCTRIAVPLQSWCNHPAYLPWVDIPDRLEDERSRNIVRFQTTARNFSLLSSVQVRSGTTPYKNPWVPGALVPGLNGRDVKLTTPYRTGEKNAWIFTSVHRLS
jgi:hypothetical protein